MPPSEQELFFYNGDGIGSEDLTLYRPHGLHPIILGDILPKPNSCVSDPKKKPRYRIAQKIGKGAFSTVWLARDLEEQKYVALKACIGTDALLQSNETKMLQRIRDHGRGKSGYENIVELYDTFIIQGPNGYHEIIVTEVIVPLYELGRKQKFTTNRAIRQLMIGFSFLHGEGIVHGDPHTGNFGIAASQLQQYDEETVADHFADPPVTPVVAKDPSFPQHSVPAYLAEIVSVASFLESKKAFPPNEDMVFKIMDFGRAYLANEEIKELPGCVPPTTRPPEVSMYHMYDGNAGSIWSLEADIWAVGCMACEIQGTRLLTSWGNSEYQLYHALRAGGPPPADWSKYWDLEKYRQEKSGLPSFDRKEAWDAVKKRLGPEYEPFFDLAQKMVVTAPEKRSPIGQLLSHPFFSEKSASASD